MSLPATDSFTDTDGTPLTTHSANWTLNFGNFQINTNSLAPNGGNVNTDACAHWNADKFNADQYAQGTVPALGGAYIGLTVRCDPSAATFYEFLVAFTDAYYLSKYVAGTGTNFSTTPASDEVAGDTLYLEVRGTTLLSKRNGVNKLGPSTDSAIASGSPGVAGNGTGTAGNRLDNFLADNLPFPYERQIILQAVQRAANF